MLVRKILIMAIVLNFALAPFSVGINSASAREIDDDSSPNNTQDINSNPNQCSAKANIEELSQEITAQLLKITQESDELKNFEAELADNNRSASNTEDELRLIYEKRYAYKIGELIVLYIPISGGTGDSFYGIQFDKSFTIVGTMAGIFKLDALNNVLFHYRINDQTIADLVITQTGEVLSGHIFDLSGNELDLQEQINRYTASGFWDCMPDCLSALGVPAYLFGGLSMICSLGCALTAGAGCVACVVAALGAYSAIGVFCVGSCIDGQW